jgi:hypothetical protein
MFAPMKLRDEIGIPIFVPQNIGTQSVTRLDLQRLLVDAGGEHYIFTPH